MRVEKWIKINLWGLRADFIDSFEMAMNWLLFLRNFYQILMQKWKASKMRKLKKKYEKKFSSCKEKPTTKYS